MVAANVNGTHVKKNVVLITGAGGWLGSVLAAQLLDDPKTPDVHLILADIVEPKPPKNAKHAVCRKADLCDPAEVKKLFQTEFGVPDTVYCFHGIMSRGSEDNFDLGLRVNVDSIHYMLDAARHAGAPRPIRFIFTSSLAVYGGEMPHSITPDTIASPQGAYGTGKLMSEFLVNEYSRRGFVDAVIVRLPTITVRPGVPSAATSAFISGIIREPIKGLEAVCPIGSSLDDPALGLEAWVASPEVTIENFVIAKHVPSEKFRETSRVVYLPGFTTTVKEELDALAEVMGKDILKLVTFKHDEVNKRIVSSWPARFDLKYPLSLGFKVDQGGMVPIVRQFLKDVQEGRA